MKLVEHGQYVSSRSQQLMLFSGRGPWNDEALFYGTKSAQSDIEAIDHTKPWAQIGFLYGESLMPPSAFKLFSEVIRIRGEIGLRAIAIVIQDSDIIFTIKTQLKKAYNAAGIESEFFSNFDEAINWVAGHKVEFDKAAVESFYLTNQFISND